MDSAGGTASFWGLGTPGPRHQGRVPDQGLVPTCPDAKSGVFASGQVWTRLSRLGTCQKEYLGHGLSRRYDEWLSQKEYLGHGGLSRRYDEFLGSGHGGLSQRYDEFLGGSRSGCMRKFLDTLQVVPPCAPAATSLARRHAAPAS